MLPRERSNIFQVKSRILRSAVPLTLLFLLIEFFDELIYGVQGAALPALRADLALSYAQIGLLLGLPQVTSTLVEPALLLLGDTGWRKRLVVGGGLAVALGLALTAGAAGLPALLIAFILGYPASGAFVTLSQATLMDLNPGREPHWMARWTVFGSLGSLAGPLLLAGGLALGLGWRPVFAGLAGLGLALALLSGIYPFPAPPAGHGREKPDSSRRVKLLQNGVLQNLWVVARNRRLWRWILLLELSDLLLDVFTGYVPLYFTDVAGVSPAQAGLLLTVLMLASLAADLALIPLLERLPGRTIVRASAVLALAVYTAWLLVPWTAAKIVLMVLVRLTTLGWYPVLAGEAYASAPGQSGTVTAIGSLAGIFTGGLAWLIGWVASQAGLPAAMWLLLIGPLSLALFVPPTEYGIRNT